MKLDIEKMKDKWILGITIFRGWIIIDLPYRKLHVMTYKTAKSIYA